MVGTKVNLFPNIFTGVLSLESCESNKVALLLSVSTESHPPLRRKQQRYEAGTKGDREDQAAQCEREAGRRRSRGRIRVLVCALFVPCKNRFSLVSDYKVSRYVAVCMCAPCVCAEGEAADQRIRRAFSSRDGI